MQLAVLAIATVAVGHPPDLEGLLFLPRAVAVLIVYGTAIGLVTGRVER